MASLSSPTAERNPDAPAAEWSAPPTDTLVVASFGDPAAFDVAVGLGAARVIDLSVGELGMDGTDLILFLPPRLDALTRNVLETVIAQARAKSISFVGLVSTHRIHFGDESAREVEAFVIDRFKGCKVAVFRTAPVLSENSNAWYRLRRFGFLATLIPARLRGCCISAADLILAIGEARKEPSRRRVYTLLGPNRPWKDWLHEHGDRGIVPLVLKSVCFVLSILLVGQLVALVVDLLSRWSCSVRSCNFDTLYPRTLPELLAIYNPHNSQHVKVVGYNNGVVHFGQQFPRKTVVSTVLIDRIRRTATDEIKVDCGVTIRKAMDFLAASEQELYVLPNYSYVCLGTAFFVPIHGSASDYATVAETMTRVLLYDPVNDRLIHASSDEPGFRDHVYHLTGNILLLRLCIRVKPKGRYFVRREKIDNAPAADLLAALRDTSATNVEMRKSHGGNATVEVSKYYQASDQANDLMELPRDSLGRLWDRLEENAVTSYLMHAFTRWFVWHVELFFTAEQFKVFWETHGSLPIRKIQLRYIRRDGLPHSPFCNEDCVSVDMFMFRWNREALESYLAKTFGVVRSNPGKHSQ